MSMDCKHAQHQKCQSVECWCICHHHDAVNDSLPSVETTRQAIIDALVKNGVIGAREAVDRLIQAVEVRSKGSGRC